MEIRTATLVTNPAATMDTGNCRWLAMITTMRKTSQMAPEVAQPL
jgi:hypothetical protein